MKAQAFAYLIGLNGKDEKALDYLGWIYDDYTRVQKEWEQYKKENELLMKKSKELRERIELLHDTIEKILK